MPVERLLTVDKQDNDNGLEDVGGRSSPQDCPIGPDVLVGEFDSNAIKCRVEKSSK